MSDSGKRDGMDRAERHADPHWWQCMLECGRDIAERKQYFNTDDIVFLMRQRHPNATTHEGRAKGPLMSALARLGYCTPTEDWIESRQKICHNRPMRVWYSLIYRGPRLKHRRRRIIDPRQYPLLDE
jgi:hypothetical protein